MIFKRIIFILSLLLCSNTAYSEIIHLLKLPMSNGRNFAFSVDQKKSCSFSGVNQIQASDLVLLKNEDSLLDKINLIQKKLNLEIDKAEFHDDRILFSIKSATNIRFEFSYDQNCALVKKFHYNNKVSLLEEINIEYSNALYSPVIKKMTIIGGGNYLNIFLYPWALRGQISTYEFSAGPALNIHTNIRKNSLLTFEKKRTVIEPIPAFFLRYGTIFLNKDGFGSLVFHRDDFNVLVMALAEGEPYKAKFLNDRNKGLYVGSILKYKSLEVIYYNDFFKNKGYNLKVKLGAEFYFNSNWKFSPQAYIQYWDKSYVDYYFGVKPSEAASGLRAYEAKHTLNYGTTLEAIHYIDNWTFIGAAGLKFMGPQVYHSPTVIKRNELRLITSVLYKFF